MSNLYPTNTVWTNQIDLQNFNEVDLTSIPKFSFNWLVLCNWQNVAIIEMNRLDMSDIDLNSFNAPNINGWWVVWHFRETRRLELDLIIKGETVEEYRNYLDAFKQQVSETEWYFNVKYVDDEVRRCKMSITRFRRTRFIWQTSGQFRMTLESLEPDWTAKDSDSQVIRWVTGDIQASIDNKWSQPTRLSSYLIFGVWTSVTALTILVNGIWFSLGESFSDWDVLFIDHQNFEVKKNGVVIDYNGALPILDRWINIINYEFTWSVDVDITNVYNKVYS